MIASWRASGQIGSRRGCQLSGHSRELRPNTIAEPSGTQRATTSTRISSSSAVSTRSRESTLSFSKSGGAAHAARASHLWRACTFAHAGQELGRLKPGRKYCTLGRLSHDVGWKYQDVVATLEAKRIVKSEAFHKKKVAVEKIKEQVKKDP